jgi:hypothetical protein
MKVSLMTWHYITLHYITLHLLGNLYVGPDDRLINPKHAAYDSEREYKLCFDSRINPCFPRLTSYMVYNFQGNLTLILLMCRLW